MIEGVADVGALGADVGAMVDANSLQRLNFAQRSPRFAVGGGSFARVGSPRHRHGYVHRYHLALSNATCFAPLLHFQHLAFRRGAHYKNAPSHPHDPRSSVSSHPFSPTLATNTAHGGCQRFNSLTENIHPAEKSGHRRSICISSTGAFLPLRFPSLWLHTCSRALLSHHVLAN